MNKQLPGGFRAGIRLHAGGTRIVVKPGSDAGFWDFGVKMLQHNKIQGVIPPEVMSRNGDPEICYDVTGLIAAGSAAPDREAPLRLEVEAQRAVEKASELMLPRSGFVFDEDLVFIEPGSGEYRFIYIPRGPGEDEGGPGRDGLAKLRDAIAARCRSAPEAPVMTPGGSAREKVKQPAGPFRLNTAVWAASVAGVFAALAILYKQYFSRSGSRAVAAMIMAGCGCAAAIFLKKVFVSRAAKEAPLPEIMIEEHSGEPNPMSYETVLLVPEAAPLREAWLAEPDSAVRIKLAYGVNRVGRNREFAEVFISEPTVGRMHAEIAFEDGIWRLTDKGSRNGTKLNGERLAEGEARELADGDAVEFADRPFIFHLDDKLDN